MNRTIVLKDSRLTNRDFLKLQGHLIFMLDTLSKMSQTVRYSTHEGISRRGRKTSRRRKG